jgi:membrane protease YdiL (CAAX protease family)
LLGFVAGGLGVALHVAIYALAGWYHVDSAQFDPLPFLLSGLAGYLVLTALPEELAFRGVLFRGIERGLGMVAALVISSLAFGLVHLMNPGATLVGALGTAAVGGVMLLAAYLLTRNLWLAIGIHWAADFWQGAVFGLHPAAPPSITCCCRPRWTVPRCGPAGATEAALSAWPSAAGRRLSCSVWAARRGHIQGWRLPWPRRDG